MKLLKKLYMSLIFLFFYTPIVLLVIFSFNDSKSRSVWKGFSLRWYKELLSNGDIMKALYYTILVAVLAAIISTIMGTIASFGIHGMPKVTKRLTLNLNYLPILNPDIITAVSMMLLFGMLKFELGFLTMLIAHITFCTPYVVLSILPKLQQMDKNLVEAAMDLGATPFYALWKIVIPEIKPGIITGALIAFTMSIDDFVISFFTTGNGVSNLSIEIFAMSRRGVKPIINAISTLMLFVLVIMLTIIFKKSKGTAEKELFGGIRNEKI